MTEAGGHKVWPYVEGGDVDVGAIGCDFLVRFGNWRAQVPRTTKTITFSLPPEMAERVDQVTKQQGRSRSEFLRKAVLRYMEEWEWRQLLQYGERRAREKGIGPEDVADLVEDYRAEVSDPL